MPCGTAEPDGTALTGDELVRSRRIVHFEVLVRRRVRRVHGAVRRGYLLKQTLRRAYRCGPQAVGRHLRSLNDEMGVIAHRAHDVRSFAALAGKVFLSITDDRG
jgi:hypothetical protein